MVIHFEAFEAGKLEHFPVSGVDLFNKRQSLRVEMYDVEI